MNDLDGSWTSAGREGWHAGLMQVRSALRIVLIGAATLATAPIAHAASLQVSPVMLNFQGGQPAQGVTLRNNGDTPLTAQVRIFAWSQDGRDDKLESVQTLVASPPMVVIAPQAEQLVRVVRTNRAPDNHELTYRLLIDELPPPQGSDSSNQDKVSGGVNFRLRYSIPVFVSPATPASEPRLVWSLRQHDGGWFLAATNQGGTHAQLSAIRLSPPSGDAFEVSAGLLGYALAGTGREWRLPDRFPSSAAVSGLKVEATVNTKASPQAPVAIETSH